MTLTTAALPDQLDLPKPRLKGALLAAVSLAFTAIGAWLGGAGEGSGWWIAAFFALCTLSALYMLFGNAGVSLDREGFVMRSPFKNHRYEWRNVSIVEIAQAPRTKFLAFDDLSKTRPNLDRVNRMLVGRNAGIPASIIGGSLQQACEQMNAFRARAVGA